MENNRIVTYSLLAHINNSGTLTKGLLEIFIPLAKRAISILNSEGIFSGKNISEISSKILELYGIDIPVPVLKNILFKISDEVNKETDNKFTLYADGAFAIKNYVFTEFDALIEKKNKQIKEIEELFKQFCKISNIDKKNYSSIFTFLEKNKVVISKYLNFDYKNGKIEDYSIEAQFVDFFRKIPPVYEIIKDLYLGTIISSYIEYSSPQIESNVELLFDTNFIISILDLNTPESTHSCRKLIEIAKQNGYKLNVLIDTIEETERLLHRRSETFNEHYLTKKINPEDIYNACDRRNLTKTDLEKIATSLGKVLTDDFGIHTIPYTEKYRNIAKHSKEYNALKEIRNNDIAALHDATALYYVREKRSNNKYKSFERVPCWFVNNSVNYVFSDSQNGDKHLKNGYQPEIIKVDILLNILWLSNPNINCSTSNKEISDTGLACLVSSTLIESMPKNAVIKELDDNINKYASSDLSAEDVVRVATRIANKQIINIEELNVLAKENKEEFVKKLQKEAEKQKEIENKRVAQIESILVELHKETEKVKQKLKSDNDLTSENETLKDKLKKSEENERKYDEQVKQLLERDKQREKQFRSDKRDEFYKTELWKWRRKSWIELSISILVFIIAGLFLFSSSDWNFAKSLQLLSELKSNIIISSLVTLGGLIFSTIVIGGLFIKYRNHSNIKAYKEGLKIPEEIKEMP